MTGVNHANFFKVKKDPRIKIYIIKKNNKTIKFSNVGFIFESFLYFSNVQIKALTSTVHSANTLMFSITASKIKY